MSHHARLRLLAEARARNKAPWLRMAWLAHGVASMPTRWSDPRLVDIDRALAANPTEARRLLRQIAFNDLRVVWHTLRLVYGR